MSEEWAGYRRPVGGPGARNHVLVIPTVICSHRVCERIVEMVPGTVTVAHPYGCSQIGDDAALTGDVLAGLGKHPNVAATLVVGLGCEVLEADRFAADVSVAAKPVDVLTIQGEGGSIRAIEVGAQRAQELVARAEGESRSKAHGGDLTLGLYTAGLEDPSVAQVANPAVGHLVDRVLAAGGRVIFGGTTHFYRAEKPLLERAADATVRAALAALLERAHRSLEKAGPAALEHYLRRHGAQTPQERATAALAQIGTGTIAGVLRFGEVPQGAGLWYMDTPNNDVEAVSAMTAAGAQLVLYTTSRIAPTGSPVTPVVKVTANAEMSARFRDHVDVDLSQAGPDELLRVVTATLSGALTKAEILGHEEFNIKRLGVTL